MKSSGCIFYSVKRSHLGFLLLACNKNGVCCIEIGKDPELLIHELKYRFPNYEIVEDKNKTSSFFIKVIEFINNPKMNINVPIDIIGTDFQKKVWYAIRQITYGETRTYFQIAKDIGFPKASRAVANACGANKIAIVIPCHRVIRKDGSIGGYHWGVDIKKKLLIREGIE